MSNLYIDTVEIVGGILTPLLVLLLFVLVDQVIIRKTANIKKHTEELRLNPDFSVRLHEVPNPKMWGVEISKDGEVLQDIGVDKL
jgi:hypothetical protein